MRSPETTASLLLVSSNTPVAVEPIDTTMVPSAPFILDFTVVVVVRALVPITVWRFFKVPAALTLN